MRPWIKRTLIKLSLWACLFLLLYVFRFPIARGLGNYLMVEDSLETCDAIFILSGNPSDRGKLGAELYKKGYAPELVCTGKDLSGTLASYGITVRHNELTRRTLIASGADSCAITLLEEGTSTQEEFKAIKTYCLSRSFKRVMIVTSLFHTRRVRQVFKKPLETAGVATIIRGCDDSGFDEKKWWEHEDGLLFLNQEYVKIMYYWWKY